MPVDTALDQSRAELARFAERHWRYNFAVAAIDAGWFSLAMSFASTATILPAFVERLGAPNVVIGAMPAINTVGFALPTLFVAGYVERLPRKLPYILLVGLFERLSLLALAAVAFLLAPRSYGLALAGALLSFAAVSIFGGAITPAWMDMFGKVMPLRYRGRQMAASSALGAAMGMAGALISGYYLRSYAFPTRYALCFVTGFGASMLSFLFLALMREPAAPSAGPHHALGAYLRRLPAVLRANHSFAWYLAAKCIGTLGSMGYGFYTVFALRGLGAAEWQVSRFTMMLLAGQTIASLFLGYVGDRVGHKRVLVAGMASVAIANLIALGARRPEHVYAAFLVVSISLAAGIVSDLNLAVEFAPEGERPTYIALAMAPIAPVAIAAPLLGGLLADLVSYRAVFALAAVAGTLAALTLATRVRDPRYAHRRDAENAEPHLSF